MSTVHKVVVDHDVDTLSNEKCLKMLKEMEKQFNTGPIIGEARELLLNLIHNLYQRDLVLDAMGMSVKKREEIFKEVCKMEEVRDNEIKEKRNGN